ncbi:hypothetical protein [Streptomyces stelliscabiei]|uniref:hypothetical protein n=1 Tax=Streptomyces stelliscabiei TaxID=146820 RepID=UPI002FF253C8
MSRRRWRSARDAVSVHVNIGSDTEGRQLADWARWARSCDTWGMPLIAMVYPRGPRIENPHDPALLAHIVNVAADLGADMVKTTVALPVERMAEVVAHSPIPVLAAGRSPDGSDLIEYGTAVMAAGCRGLAVGRGSSPPPPRPPWSPGSRRGARGGGDGITEDMSMTAPPSPRYSTIVAGVA